MRYSYLRIIAPAILVVLAAALGAIVYQRQGAFQAVKGAPLISPHDGYETLAGRCDLCHDISRAREAFPANSLDTANLFCVTCHVPGVPRPDPRALFSPRKVPGSSGQGSRAPHGADVAGGQPPSGVRLVLNSLGSGMSVYQEDPYDPSLSGHRGMLCLNCHTAHSSKKNQIRSNRGAVTGGKILKTQPTRELSLAQAPGSLVLDNWAAEGAAWCLSCHPEDSSATGHNHPDYLCLQCHQDTGLNSQLSSAQFPHTAGTPNLLAADPDVLCISCHTKGSIP